MAWKWYEIKNYKVSVGGSEGDYYGGVQLFGDGFFTISKCKWSLTFCVTKDHSSSVGKMELQIIST